MAALAVAASLAAGLGVYYLYTALALGWRGAAPAPPLTSARRSPSHGRDWLARAGLAGMAPREFVGATLVVALVGGLFGFLLFGGVVPALVCATFAGALPIASARRRRTARREQAQEAWPRLIEE